MRRTFFALTVLSVLSLSGPVLGRIPWEERAGPGSTPTGNIGNFGKCSVPEIEFGNGFDNRRETSFQPKDKVSYNHGSAQNIGVISKFICDTLVNSCGADQTARTTCASALAAADREAAKTGAQADKFNSVFGIKTNFNAITPLDDHGDPVSNGGPSPNTASTQAPNFGQCSTPEIKFAANLEGRRETAFIAQDQKSFPHGSADNIGVITQFMCDQLTNTCKANQAAKDLCKRAQAAANTAPPLTGKQADAFNLVFGIKTNFAAVTPIDNTGKPVTTKARRANPAVTESVEALDCQLFVAKRYGSIVPERLGASGPVLGATKGMDTGRIVNVLRLSNDDVIAE